MRTIKISDYKQEKRRKDQERMKRKKKNWKKNLPKQGRRSF
jgi:hypothetical protein